VPELTPANFESAKAAAAHATFNRIPTATYRLQLSAALNFDRVARLIDYLNQLGISDLYLSPLFRAREESSHGYDVVSHAEIEREFGDIVALERLTDKARSLGMGVVLDVVPNHMGVNDRDNGWWWDVLENGPHSQYASYFDIDWDRASVTLRNKLLLPFLGDHFGAVLERGELRLVYENERLQIAYFEKRYPLSPLTWPAVLELALENADFDQTAPERLELRSIISQLRNLVREPSQVIDIDEMYREQLVARQRLNKVVNDSSEVQAALKQALKTFNGNADDSESFDRLETLLNQQWYRLAYWRVAADEINYRRFFDVNDLAAIRVENSDVFAAVHSLVRQLLSQGRITGLRIDHPDGLFDPQEYFGQLQRLYLDARPESSQIETSPLYIVAEKILTGDEDLPHDWSVAGTTGYDALGAVSRVLVDESGLERLARLFQALTNIQPNDILYRCKRQILQVAMSSELHMLAGQLYRMAQRSRSFRDFTYPSLLRTLQEIIACFPVYRTYIRSKGWDVTATDHGRVALAIRIARRRNPNIDRSVFDFVAAILLLQFPPTFDKSHQDEWRYFALKFQQVTGPVTAKGVEDTAFYRYFPLASLNEVGSDIKNGSCDIGPFHAFMQRRLLDWPHSLSATATHDTKRGEDTRARMHVIAEAAEQWIELINRWDALTAPVSRMIDDVPAPSTAERYLFYQTVVATVPLDDAKDNWHAYTERIVRYMQKALREAKLHTSWASPNTEYEDAVLNFVKDLLDDSHSNDFSHEITAFARSISDAGYINSLAQLALKLCIPGVPDFYQGTEFWDFSLVDPDNRRPVNFEKRQAALAELAAAFDANPQKLLTDLAAHWPDSRIKMFFAWRLLHLRQEFSSVFSHGAYFPLLTEGTLRQHVLAFARQLDATWIVVVVPRLVHRLLQQTNSGQQPHHPWTIDWQDTTIKLPPEAGCRFVSPFTQETVNAGSTNDSQSELSLDLLFAHLPVVVLVSKKPRQE
jgi:(1->4)-alpha-D-glucan 1-alpha-D-glucosylmutase